MTIELTDVHYSYPARQRGSSPALVGVSLVAGERECLGVVGPEGGGKSTLLSVMDALLKPDAGQVLRDGEDVWEDPADLASFRRGVGLCFQFPEQQFLCETVGEELLFGILPEDRDAMRGNAFQLLREFGLSPDAFLHRSPFSLSMGESRRVAIASSLIRQPHLLLLDEPSAGLDGKGLQQLEASINIAREHMATMVIVSHDLDFLASFATRVIILAAGSIRYDGPAEDLLFDRARLRAYGYDVPEIVEVIEQLRASGSNIRQRLCSIGELQAAAEGLPLAAGEKRNSQKE